MGKRCRRHIPATRHPAATQRFASCSFIARTRALQSITISTQRCLRTIERLHAASVIQRVGCPRSRQFLHAKPTTDPCCAVCMQVASCGRGARIKSLLYPSACCCRPRDPTVPRPLAPPRRRGMRPAPLFRAHVPPRLHCAAARDPRSPSDPLVIAQQRQQGHTQTQHSTDEWSESHRSAISRTPLICAAPPRSAESTSPTSYPPLTAPPSSFHSLRSSAEHSPLMRSLRLLFLLVALLALSAVAVPVHCSSDLAEGAKCGNGDTCAAGFRCYDNKVRYRRRARQPRMCIPAVRASGSPERSLTHVSHV